ncbi:MAG: winged helix-turn-helix domain-containing protein [Pseudomonadales bacterium]
MAASYQFGDWTVLPEANQLCRGGRSVRLQNKEMEVLCCLLERAGKVVSLGTLLEVAWGRQVVEPNVVHRALSRIRRALQDDPRQPEYIETIPKRGYRTVAVVTKKYIAGVDEQFEQTVGERQKVGVTDETLGEHGATAATIPARNRASHFIVACSLIALLVLSADGLNSVDRAESLRSKSELTIEVHPFQNLSPLAEHEYYASGFYEELVNRLSKLQGVAVVLGKPDAHLRLDSDHQAFAQSSADKGLRGSLRYDSDRDWVSVTVRIVDLRTSRVDWSERYEQRASNLAGLQGAIAQQVASRLQTGNAPIHSAAIAAVSTHNADAYALYLKVLADLRSLQFRSAHVDLDRAIALDPGFTLAVAQKAHLYSLAATSGFGSSEPMSAKLAKRYLEEAKRYAHRALAADVAQPLAILALARVRFAERRWIDAFAHAEEAHALAPNDTSTQFFYAMNLMYRQHSKEAILMFQKVILAEPWNPSLPLFAGGRAIMAGEHAMARRWLSLAAERSRGELAHYAYAMLVQNAMYAGLQQEARSLLQRVELLFPDESSGPVATAILLDAYTQMGIREAQQRYRLKLEQQLAARVGDAGSELALRLSLRDSETAMWAFNRVLEFGFPAIDAADLNFHSDSSKFETIRAHPDFALLKARAAKPRQVLDKLAHWNPNTQYTRAEQLSDPIHQ